MVVVIWLQLYNLMFFLRLLKLYDVYHAHPLGESELVPREDLVGLFEKLEQKPKWSQVVELLSFLPPGPDSFTFDEFCQLAACLDRMERAERFRRRAETRTSVAFAAHDAPLLRDHRDQDLQGRFESEQATLATRVSYFPDMEPSAEVAPEQQREHLPVLRIAVTEEEFRAGAVVGGAVGEFKARALIASGSSLTLQLEA